MTETASRRRTLDAVSYSFCLCVVNKMMLVVMKRGVTKCVENCFSQNRGHLPNDNL